MRRSSGWETTVAWGAPQFGQNLAPTGTTTPQLLHPINLGA